MKIILDNREHALFEKCRAIIESSTKTSFVQLSIDVLAIGDILVTTDEDKPVLLVERKSFSDLLASIKDGRYEEQSYRLLHASDFPPHSIYYVLEGMFSQLRNPAEKSIILSAATSLSFFKGFSVHRTATVQETAEWLVHMADKIEREFGKGTLPYYLRSRREPVKIEENEGILKANVLEESSEPLVKQGEPLVKQGEPLASAQYCAVVKKVKKENVTPENIGEIVLCQIPGISSATAIAIMKRFGRFPDLIAALTADPKCLSNVVLDSGRKINKSAGENIKRYLLPTSMSTLV